jgi:hypothetical protein
MGVRCFIAAPGEADVRPLVAALQEREWETFVLADVAKLGSSLDEALLDAVRSADLVLALFHPDWPPASTAFEVGLAVGQGKPALLLVSPGMTLPINLQSLFQVRADVSNAQALALALDNVERYLSEFAESQGQGRSVGRPIGDYADELLHKVRERGASEADLEAAVGMAIERSGAVVSAAAEPDKGFDLGVWADDLDAIGANPILVEVKKRADSETVRQCLAAIHQVPGSRAALVVSLEDLEPVEMKWLRWPVLGISLERLLEEMRDRSFAEVIRDLRSRSAHGQTA